MRENRLSGLMRGRSQTVIGLSLSIRRLLPTLHIMLEDGILRVISPEFRRLEISIYWIPALAKVHKESAERFEIDEDGSFI